MHGTVIPAKLDGKRFMPWEVACPRALEQLFLPVNDRSLRKMNLVTGVAQCHSSFGPVCEVEFGKDASHMVFHRFFVQVKLQRNALVA